MKFKKALSIILITLFSIVFISCGKVTDSRSQDIPKDGIVKSKVFEDLMFDDDMMMFNGSSDDISYQWTFVGGSIKNPTDLNLLLKFSNKKSNEVKEKLGAKFVQGFSYCESNNIKWSPSLSITLNKKLDCSLVTVYKSNNDDYTKVSDTTIDEGTNGTISFTVTENIGEFYIVGTGESTAEEDIDNSDLKEANNNGDENKEEGNEFKKYLTDDYKDSSKASNGVKISDGSRTTQDKYLTDPVPKGKQEPVEPGDVKIDKSKVRHCTLSIRCDTLLKEENYNVAKSNGKASMIPADGVIYSTKKVEFYQGESVFDVLLREVQKYGIHMEYSMTPMYNSNYIEGINNLYEFNGGELSGWMYKVNGWFPNYGCSRYSVQDGDVIEWVYTCDLGRDVGCEWLGD